MKKKFECGLYDKIPLKFNLIEKIEFFCRYHETTPDDCMIILGDAGINFAWITGMKN